MSSTELVCVYVTACCKQKGRQSPDSKEDDFYLQNIRQRYREQAQTLGNIKH